MNDETSRSQKDSTMLRISDIGPNQEVSGVFVVEEKQLRTTKNGKPFLTLKLRDKTGTVTARLWENAEEASQAMAGHKVFQVQGRSELFRDEIQVHVQSFQPVPMEKVKPGDFLPVCPRDRKELWSEFLGMLQKLTQKPLRNLAKCLCSDKTLMEGFRTAPGAKSVHHAYLGGLLEHTVGVMRLTTLIADQYPSLDRELLLMGAFLHDIGKVKEYTYDLVIDYSDEGRLVGHMVLGVEILTAKVAACKDFPTETSMLLKHLILSHHGETEYGAVQKPMTREALALHLADDLDARMNSLDDIFSKNEDPESAWTAYQSIYGRYFYRGCRNESTPGEASSPLSRNGTVRESLQLPLWPEAARKGSSHEDA